MPDGRKPHVDLVELTLGGLGRDRRDEALAQAGIVGVGRQGARTVRLRSLRCVVDEDEVEVGADGELARAELAEAEHDEGAARDRPVLRDQPLLGRGQERAEHDLGNGGERGRGLGCRAQAQQHLEAGLELAAMRPAADGVQHVLEVADVDEVPGELLLEGGRIGQALEEVGGEHRLQEVDATGELAGEARGRAHEVGQEGEEVQVLAQEREDLHARRQAGQELVEQAEGGIGVGLLLERAEERGRELGEELARPRAAGGADVAVVPGPHPGGDGGRVLEAHAGEGGDRARIVLRAGEDEAAAGPEVGLALEEGGVVALDRGERDEDGLPPGRWRPGKPAKAAKRSNSPSRSGRAWVCLSATICSRCSSARSRR